MTELATDLARPRGRCGVDGDYRLIPTPVVVAVFLIAAGVNVWRFSRRGKFEVWARLLTGLGLRGDEQVELHTRDMTDLRFPDEPFDLVVSNLAIHNLPDDDARRAAIDEAVRVLRPGGHVVIADLGITRLYANRLQQCGMADVRRRDLGWRAWWGLPFFQTHAVTPTKPGPTR
jgi:arsenite methyltransferase